MDVIRRSVRPLVGADGVTFVMRDRSYCYYAEEDAIGPLWKGRRFPLESCVSGWVMMHGAPAVIPDVYADPRVPGEAYRPTFVKSLAMVPVSARHSMAAIGAYWAERHTASPAEVNLLQQIAASAAVVLEQTCPRCHLRGHVHVEKIIRGENNTVEGRSCAACGYAWC